MVNPYYHLPKYSNIDSLNIATKNQWMQSNPKDLDNLKQLSKRISSNGAQEIVIMTNQHLPYREFEHNYSLYANKDQDHFYNLSSAHIDLLRTIHKSFDNTNNAPSIYFSPPWNNLSYINKSRGRAAQYFQDLRNRSPESIHYLWSGNANKSYAFDGVDIHRIKKIMGEQPILLDNTFFNPPDSLSINRFHKSYPGKVRLCNLFEPYDLISPESYDEQKETERIMNSSLQSPVEMIRLMTAGAYLWNTEDYNSDFVLWNILVSEYNKKIAKELISFNDYFYNLKAIWLVRKSLEDPDYYESRVEQLITELQNSFDTVSELCSDKHLNKSLYWATKKLINRFD